MSLRCVGSLRGQGHTCLAWGIVSIQPLTTKHTVLALCGLECAFYVQTLWSPELCATTGTWRARHALVKA
eukprot:15445662-Alexandrium_andersonii.AAC.1